MIKKIITCIILTLFSYTVYGQCTPKSLKPWVLSTSAGYVNVSNIKPKGATYQSNGWSSLNLNYNIKKWSFGTWAGTNYYINGNQLDLRFGISITYTIKRW